MSGHKGAEFLAPVYLAGIAYYLWRLRNHKEIPGDSPFNDISHAWMLVQMFYNDVVQPNLRTSQELDLAVAIPALAFVTIGMIRYVALRWGSAKLGSSTPLGELIHIGMHVNNSVHTMFGSTVHHLGINPGVKEELARLVVTARTNENIANLTDILGVVFNSWAGLWVMPRYIRDDLQIPERRLRAIELWDDFFHQVMFVRMGVGHASSLLN